jgi:hypothetical protein
MSPSKATPLPTRKALLWGEANFFFNNADRRR